MLRSIDGIYWRIHLANWFNSIRGRTTWIVRLLTYPSRLHGGVCAVRFRVLPFGSSQKEGTTWGMTPDERWVFWVVLSIFKTFSGDSAHQIGILKVKTFNYLRLTRWSCLALLLNSITWASAHSIGLRYNSQRLIPYFAYSFRCLGHRSAIALDKTWHLFYYFHHRRLVLVLCSFPNITDRWLSRESGVTPRCFWPYCSNAKPKIRVCHHSLYNANSWAVFFLRLLKLNTFRYGTFALIHVSHPEIWCSAETGIIQILCARFGILMTCSAVSNAIVAWMRSARPHRTENEIQGYKLSGRGPCESRRSATQRSNVLLVTGPTGSERYIECENAAWSTRLGSISSLPPLKVVNEPYW